jgi:hypothetical protein
MHIRMVIETASARSDIAIASIVQFNLPKPPKKQKQVAQFNICIGQYALGRATLPEARLPTLDALCPAIIPDIRIDMAVSKCLLWRKLPEYS